jgi:hypothetical protein
MEIFAEELSAGGAFERMVSHSEDYTSNTAHRLVRYPQQVAVAGTLWFGWSGGPGTPDNWIYKYSVGLRFNNILIPKKSTIVSALFSFSSQNITNLSDGFDFKIYGFAKNNLGPFSANYGPLTIERTATGVVSNIPSNFDGTGQRDIAFIVQNIIDREDWTYGNALGFLMRPQHVFLGEVAPASWSSNEITIGIPSIVIDYLEPGHVEIETPLDIVPEDCAFFKKEWHDQVEFDSDHFGTSTTYWSMSELDRWTINRTTPSRLHVIWNGAIRLRNIAIPKQSTILSASLEIWQSGGYYKNGSDVYPPDAKLYAAANDNVSAFFYHSANDRHGVDEEILTPSNGIQILSDATAHWNNGRWVNIDVAPLIQPVVNREGWTYGGAIALIGKTKSVPFTTGSVIPEITQRVNFNILYDKTGEPGGSPILSIEYLDPGYVEIEIESDLAAGDLFLSMVSVIDTGSIPYYTTREPLNPLVASRFRVEVGKWATTSPPKIVRYNRSIGVRFSDILIPKNSTIQQAKFKNFPQYIDNSPAHLKAYMVDEINAEQFFYNSANDKKIPSTVPLTEGIQWTFKDEELRPFYPSIYSWSAKNGHVFAIPSSSTEDSGFLSHNYEIDWNIIPRPAPLIGNEGIVGFSKVANDGEKVLALILDRLWYYDGSSWTEQQPAGDVTANWNSLDIADGKMVACIYGGRLYYFNGTSWSEQQPAGNANKNWIKVACSGNRIVASIGNGRLYYHNGTSWSEQQPAGNINTSWMALDISGDKIIAGPGPWYGGAAGRLYYYNGASWSEIRPDGDRNGDWYYGTIENDKIAVFEYGKRIYFKNGINDWTELQPLGDSDFYWEKICIDENKIIVKVTNGKLIYFNGILWDQLPTVPNYKDLTSRIQGMVDREDWTYGNAIALVVKAIDPIEGTSDSHGVSFYVRDFPSPAVEIEYLEPGYVEIEFEADNSADGFSTFYTGIPFAAKNHYDNNGPGLGYSQQTGSPSPVVYKYNSTFRWDNIIIPKGSLILYAKVNFVASGIWLYADHFNFRAFGIDTDNFDSIGTEPWSLPLTATGVAGVVTQNEVTQNGDRFNPKDVTLIVQNIVDRGAWTPGNALGIMFKDTTKIFAGISHTTGMSIYNNVGLTGNPILEIEYQEPESNSVRPKMGLHLDLNTWRPA